MPRNDGRTGRETVAAALAAQKATPPDQRGIRKHPHIEEINRAILREEPIHTIVDRYFQKELTAGVSKPALNMRVSRYKNGPFAKIVKRSQSRKRTREVNKLEELAQQAYLDTADLSLRAADRDKWEQVAGLRSEARQDLVMLGKITGEITDNDERQTTGVNIQNIIALPRNGPMYADEVEGYEPPGYEDAIDVSPG